VLGEHDRRVEQPHAGPEQHLVPARSGAGEGVVEALDHPAARQRLFGRERRGDESGLELALEVEDLAAPDLPDQVGQRPAEPVERDHGAPQRGVVVAVPAHAAAHAEAARGLELRVGRGMQHHRVPARRQRLCDRQRVLEDASTAARLHDVYALASSLHDPPDPDVACRADIAESPPGGPAVNGGPNSRGESRLGRDALLFLREPVS
jgi:hypothetical protein